MVNGKSSLIHHLPFTIINMSVRIKILASVYIFILAGIIFFADFYGTNFFTIIDKIPFGDKIGHFLLMGGFSLMLNLALEAKSFQIFQLRYLLGSLLVFGLVTIEEFSQIFVAGRTFDSQDLLFDYAGIFLFGEAARFLCRKIIKS